MRINHNISALNAWRNLFHTDNNLSKSMERLSSGLRINRASDDAAGLAISEKMRGQIGGLHQAVRNAQDGISLLQTAEGALNETHSILQRMRELSVQAASDALTMTDRLEIQKEVDQLKEEIDGIANTTEFNTKKLLDGSASALVSASDGVDVLIRDGLEVRDAFGQTQKIEGNYRLDIQGEAGKNQVQKSHIFTAREPDAAGSGVADATALRDVAQFWDANGNFLLQDPATITVQQGDGQSTRITLYGDDTIADLRDKLNSALAHGLEQGEGVDEAERDKFVSYVRPSQVAFSAMSDLERVIFGLQNAWLEVSENRVEEYYSLTGSNSPVPDLSVQIYDKEPFGTLALIASTVNLGEAGNPEAGRAYGHELWIDLQDFAPATWPYGDTHLSEDIGLYADRIVAHEMTHAVMSVNMNWIDLSIWFKEGTAEMLHGRREITVQDMETRLAQGMTEEAAAAEIMGTLSGLADSGFLEDAYDDNWEGSNAQYTASYIATWYLMEAMAPEDTMADFMAYLSDSTLSQALNEFTGYADDEAFITAVSGNAGRDFLLALYNNPDFHNTEDTGAIGGYLVSGGDVLSPQYVLDYRQATRQGEQPLEHWNVHWPDPLEIADNPTFDPLQHAATQLTPGQTRSASEGLEATEGTLVLRSALAGPEGDIHFIADDGILQALGFSTIQESSSTVFTVDIRDAHTDELLMEGVGSSDNTIVGALHQNLDIVLDSQTGIQASWDEETLNWTLAGGEEHSTHKNVHVANNTMMFHIGANALQNVASGIADMGIKALGIHNLMVTDADSANASIHRIDSAIERVSGERSKLGALQNRLEHTIQNLMVAAENLTAAESRIRDVDMAAEMMDFTRGQILMQAGTAMLAQANMRPQSVLQLLG